MDPYTNEQDYNKLYRDVIRIAEGSSNARYEGRQKVDYVVRGTLTESTLEQIYDDPLWLFADDGDPGTCDYEAAISLSVEAISLPRVRRSKKWRRLLNKC